MELATVILIIAILMAMLVPGFAYMRARAERSKCFSNLTSIYVAGTLYIQDHGSWPQIDPETLNTPAYPTAWVAAFAPYKIAEKNWACPSVQRMLNDPDLTKPEGHRVDYFGTPFGDERNLPYKYAGQPWFIERADVHGDGQLILFPDGSIKALRDVVRDSQFQHVDW